MTILVERISDDVSCSPDPNILADWKNSSDELLIWRRPDFDTASVDAYIDFLAAKHPSSMRALDRMYFLYDTNDGYISPHRDVDYQKLEEFGIPQGADLIRKIFFHDSGQPLIDDVYARLSIESKVVFPAAKTLLLHLRTMTAPAGIVERFHLDDSAVLGLAYGKFGTEYLRSNTFLSAEKWATLREKQSIRADLIPKSETEALKSGDISMMRFKPHRPYAMPTGHFKFWLGAAVYE